VEGEGREGFYSSAEAAKILKLTPRRVQQLADAGELVGEKDGRAWRLARWSVHRYREEHAAERPRVSRAERQRVAGEDARELLEAVRDLERRLGRAEAVAELTAQAESSVRGERDRLLRERDQERQRADELQRELEEARLQLAASRSPEPTEEPTAPERPIGGPVTASEPSEGVDVTPPPIGPENPSSRPWWRRLLGG
jgi:excisionase family DNA binding protein